MAKNVAVVIQEDPRKTHRPVEALRIALGLSSGSHRTTVVLLGEAVRLISEDRDEILNMETLETYLPSIKDLHIPFILPSTTEQSSVSKEFNTRYQSDENISSFLQSMDRTLVF